MKNIIFCLLCIAALSSCSVIMAAKKDGVSIEKVQSSYTRGQMIATGATIISSDYLPNGQLVEVYQCQKERGSATRAFMHGVLDVSTFGLWEVIGTPIEACANEKQYYCVKITYDQNEIVQYVELL